MHSRKTIALISFVFTYLFFFEYISPVRWVHLPYDLNGFHYPLADYAFQRLRHGQFPLWDPTIYCGMSFVSNIQAALFYPPTWLMFLINFGRERLSYQSMQDLLIAHVWLGFFLCYLWLRGKRLAELPSAMGAGVFAFSGYMCTQLQHFGLVAGYVWLPLALWGIDQAAERRSWRPLWKVAAASALCFLAGYPPTWMMFAVATGVYALASAWRPKAALVTIGGTLAALIFSLMLCAIQILPTWETTALRQPEDHFGLGIRGWDILLSYTVPNFFNFGLNVPVPTNPGKDYLYLGLPALLGLPLLLRRGRYRDLMPSLAVLGASLLVAGNPFDLVSNAIEHSTLLPDIVRSWYFLAGVTLALAPLTAFALDDFLARKTHTPAWFMPLSVTLMAAWTFYELYRWRSQSLAEGWRSGLFVLATLAIFTAGMFAFRVEQGRRRTWMAVALLLFAGADYKAFGTSKRFNGSLGDAQRWSFVSFPGMMPDVYQQLRTDMGTHRILVDPETGPLAEDFRHIGLTTPQGFDPLLTTPYRKMVERYGHFRTDRIFDVDLENYDALRLFGVRYVISSEYSKQFPKVKDNPHYRLLGSIPTFYRVYEYLDAVPPFSWEGSAGDAVDRQGWEPEDRRFVVRSASGGKLALHEQLFPGWTATVDGKSAGVEPWAGAFQAVAVPAGEHIVEFRYRSRLLGVGGGISLAALMGLAFWVWSARESGTKVPVAG